MTPSNHSQAAARGWESFWSSGAFVDLADSATGQHTDERARELERRVVLSQYLTRVNSAGSTPPQETGYTLNSWYGKHHHEMRWWHQAHFALWQRAHLLQVTLSPLLNLEPQPQPQHKPNVKHNRGCDYSHHSPKL